MKLKAFILIFLMTIFAACSSDDDNNKEDDKIEIEYLVKINSQYNFIQNITYTDADGNDILVPSNDDSVILVDGIRQWSKKIMVVPPYNASIKMNMQNTLSVPLGAAVLIYKGEQVLDYSNVDVPSGTTYQSIVSATVTE